MAKTPTKGRKSLQIERLEERYVMDGAGFVHTDPAPDPGSVVGVAGIVANDDYIRTALESGQLRIDVLGNDILPSASGRLSLKSVSATARGATVAISDDGQRIVYTPPAEGGYDSFYYIVQDENGKLGKANVTVQFESASTYTPSPTSDDWFDVFEDSGEAELPVLANDGEFADGEIIAVTSPTMDGTVRIAEDGKSLVYQPQHGKSGVESFEYTVRRADGEAVTHRVMVRIQKPFDTRWDTSVRLNIDSGAVILDPLANDFQYGPTPEPPRIVAVSQPPLGTLRISDDGKHLIFEPAEGFIGSFSYQYTVAYGPEEHQRVEGSGYVSVLNTFLAVDDWRGVDAGSGQQVLDVLKNDPVIRRYELPDVTVRIISASAGSHGGQLAVSADGKTVLYAPAAGFLGDETFTYVVEDSTGHRDSAVVTVHVAEETPDPAGVPKFTQPGELEQFLIDVAVKQYMSQFGLVHQWYDSSGNYLTGDMRAYLASDHITTQSHSSTNTQVAGVDEADVVETDGRYLYTFADGKLAIVDLADPAHPMLISLTNFDDRYEEMYLQGDRLTLINRGSHWGEDSKAIVTVLNIADRAHPIIQERTEIDGRIVDSRAVGDRAHIAALGLNFPEIGTVTIADPPAPGEPGLRRYESLDEYVGRVRGTLIDSALPHFRTYDAGGQLVRSGLLMALGDIHKPIDAIDASLLSLAVFDIANDMPGPDATTGIFTGAASEVYMSGDACYVLRSNGAETAIFKFAAPDDGGPTLEAVGKVDGALLNQFSIDEYDGRLRIATTTTVFEDVGNGQFRQQRRSNNLFILEQVGAQLVVVGSVENLAPTETIKSVRFLGDRAYVVTFRVVDPLFAIDLSDPTAPSMKGSLKIPGFSDYLHPVGENYVIGIGRDADEITGQVGLPQISLFYVGDLDNPVLVDQITMEGVEWAMSEAFDDHHAVAYFAEHGTLAIPVSWNETVDVDDDDDGFVDRREYSSHSAIWAFQIDVDQAGGGSIDVAGRVDHDGEARRSVRIGDHLITVSNVGIKVHDLHDLEQQVGELYLGSLATADTFTVQEDSGPAVLDVRANDRPGNGDSRIVSVTQPTAGGYVGWYGVQSSTGESAGVVTISDDGQSIIFTPKADFFGTAKFTYTIHDAVRGDMQATVTLHVENVADAPMAVEDEFAVRADGAAVRLDVLANDVNADHREWPVVPYGNFDVGIDRSSMIFAGNLAIDTINGEAPIRTIAFLSDYRQGLTITNVSPGSHGGTISVETSGGAITYQPAPGFVGAETFTYKIKTNAGLVATGTVTVNVGGTDAAHVTLAAPAEAPDESPQLPNERPLPNLEALFDSESNGDDRKNASPSDRACDPAPATPFASASRQQLARADLLDRNVDSAFGELLDFDDEISTVADELSAEFASQFD